MDDILRAYLAGCMDCDGSFTIKTKPYKNTRYHLPRVAFWQTKPQIVAILHRGFGGSVRQVERKPPAKNQYAWEATYKAAVSLCKAVLPYLVLKRRQAEILIELDQSMSRSYSNPGIPSVVVALRCALHDEIRRLNKKGRHD